MYSMPELHHRQVPQTATNDVTTWSPGENSLTPSPTSTTTPDPSWPPIIGNMPGRPKDSITSLGTDMSPLRMCSSE
jgi:hypothetical protein